ncbi:hypothetical protein HYQ46_001514 [Verticillium longisporum]|nr:hypothetical protein HYQ44_010485 [Verticillium longisporum]KAG7149572.1 hypothetical protein HYQ46_001514 [Verticillium longisporum]
MAILKSFRVISPISAPPSTEIIYISDDSDSDDDDAGHSSDECEFEDVFRRSVDRRGEHKASDKEFGDAEIGYEERSNNENEDVKIDSEQSDRPFSPGNAVDCGTNDECDVTETVLLNEPCDEEVVDRNLNDTRVQADEELKPVDASTDNEAISINLNNNLGTHHAGDTITVPDYDREDVIAEIAALREQLTRLEARIDSKTVALPGMSPPRKRKRIASTVSYLKKPKIAHSVNISATRVCLQSDSGSESRVYSWQRGRGGRCWVRDEGAGRRDEEDGEYLLCFGSNISIDVRVNADWLPITVRLNVQKNVFEGFESIGGRRLDVKDTVMIQLMRDGRGEHFGMVS